MTRHLFAVPVILLLAAGAVCAQPPYETYKEIYSRSELASGVYSMYPAGQPEAKPAPEGYKPFYISHIGRHGARHPLGETVYTDILDVFTDASSRGLLTESGEEFLRVYSEFYPLVAHREGELTFKGQEQHRQIVRQMYRDFPEVFEGPTRAVAYATHIHRVIASMYTFLAEALVLDPDFTFTADYGLSFLPFLLPTASECPGFVPLNPFPEDVRKRFGDYSRGLLDISGMLGLWFKDSGSLKMAPLDLLRALNTLYSSFSNLDVQVPERLWTMFSFDDRYKLWEADNCRWFLMFGRVPGVDNYVTYMKSIVGDIISHAASDWQEGIALRLRFSHDSAIAPLLSYLDINGMGVAVSDPASIRDSWRNFEIPMAANIQFVFYRRGADFSASGDSILLQVLHNGFPATLPLSEAAPGFYRWNDFVRRFSE